MGVDLFSFVSNHFNIEITSIPQFVNPVQQSFLAKKSSHLTVYMKRVRPFHKIASWAKDALNNGMTLLFTHIGVKFRFLGHGIDSLLQHSRYLPSILYPRIEDVIDVFSHGSIVQITD